MRGLVVTGLPGPDRRRMQDLRGRDDDLARCALLWRAVYATIDADRTLGPHVRLRAEPAARRS